MLNLIKINSYPHNYLESQRISAPSEAVIPFGCPLIIKDGNPTLATDCDFPSHLTVRPKKEGECEVFVCPISENMVFEASLKNLGQAQIGDRLGFSYTEGGECVLERKEGGAALALDVINGGQRVLVKITK